MKRFLLGVALTLFAFNGGPSVAAPFTVPKPLNRTDMIDRLNATIAQLRASDEYDEIMSRYMPPKTH